MLSDQKNTMRQLATEQSFPEERLLINELTHRINNEFASAISLVSLAAVRSSNREVKVALTSVVELLHHYADVYRALQMPEHRTRIDVAAYLPVHQPIQAGLRENKPSTRGCSFVDAIGPMLATRDDRVRAYHKCSAPRV
jgi:two-component sensor histidine kinase